MGKVALIGRPSPCPSSTQPSRSRSPPSWSRSRRASSPASSAPWCPAHFSAADSDCGTNKPQKEFPPPNCQLPLPPQVISIPARQKKSASRDLDRKVLNVSSWSHPFCLEMSEGCPQPLDVLLTRVAKSSSKDSLRDLRDRSWGIGIEAEALFCSRPLLVTSFHMSRSTGSPPPLRDSWARWWSPRRDCVRGAAANSIQAHCPPPKGEHIAQFTLPASLQRVC